MKRYRMLALLLLIVVSLSNVVLVRANVGKNIYVSINGKKIAKAYSGKKKGKGYLVKAKRYAKRMGLKYRVKGKRIIIRKSKKKMVFRLNKKKVKFGKKTIKTKLKARKIKSIVYVDPKVVAKNFGFKYVTYNSKEETLEVYKKKPKASPTANPTVLPVTPTPTLEPGETPAAGTTPTPMPVLTPTPTPNPQPVPSGLPSPVPGSLTRIFIETKDGKEILEDKEEEIEATITIDDGRENPSLILDTKNIVLSGRGNSTFYETEGFDKKPLKFDFANKEEYGICGMPPARKWNLLAELFDRSLVRNHLALKLGKSLVGLRYTPGSELTELYLNGKYHGVYLLTEAVEVHKNRLDLDITGDEPGFLVEWDQRAREEAEEKYNALKDKTGRSPFDYYFNIPTLSADPDNERYKDGVKFAYKFPKGKDMTQQQRNFIKNTVTSISDLLVSAQDGRYADKVDLDSFVDYYLLTDFFQNSDAVNFSSIYLFQDKGGKLNMGPIWDYDLYIGNNGNGPDRKCLEWGNPWFNPLFTRSALFRNKMADRWQEVKPIVQREVIDYLDELEVKLDEAQKRNYQRWGNLNHRFEILGNREPLGSWKAEVEYLRNWLKERVKFADGYYR